MEVLAGVHDEADSQFRAPEARLVCGLGTEKVNSTYIIIIIMQGLIISRYMSMRWERVCGQRLRVVGWQRQAPLLYASF